MPPNIPYQSFKTSSEKVVYKVLESEQKSVAGSRANEGVFKNLVAQNFRSAKIKSTAKDQKTQTKTSLQRIYTLDTDLQLESGR